MCDYSPPRNLVPQKKKKTNNISNMWPRPKVIRLVQFMYIHWIMKKLPTLRSLDITPLSHLENIQRVVLVLNIPFPTYNKNMRQSVLYTSTIKWIYFTRGPNIFLCCPRMHRRCQCVIGISLPLLQTSVYNIFFCSTIGLIIKPSVTLFHVTHYQNASACLTGTICKGKKKEEKGPFKKIIPSSFEQKGTGGVVLEVNKRSVRLLGRLVWRE